LKTAYSKTDFSAAQVLLRKKRLKAGRKPFSRLETEAVTGKQAVVFTNTGKRRGAPIFVKDDLQGQNLRLGQLLIAAQALKTALVERFSGLGHPPE
jgi:hypothetical protein